MLEDFYKQRTVYICILVAAIILGIDYITGRYVRFPILYILPIIMAAWQQQRPLAYALAVVMPLARIGFHFPWQETQLLSLAVLNAVIFILALVFYTYLADRVAWQNKALMTKVRTLEGILPICASCKRIRNEAGEYVQMEKYISEHSQASFSHGLCRECARKLYPDLVDED